MKAGVPVTDVTAGLCLCVGVIAALRARDVDGVGQRVSTSLLGAGLLQGIWEAGEYWADGTVPTRLGNVHRGFAPYQLIRAGLGTSFVIAANTDAMFADAARAFGRPAWLLDDAFRTNSARLANRDSLASEIEEVARSLPAAEWVARLTRVRVPACEVLDYRRALEHAQALAIGMVVDSTDESGEALRILGNPLLLSRTPVTYRAAAPELGDTPPM
jgi:crotonobetainyl-CoA:carnitine CoA-transferase CaiB-like acyl-CoA transferase